MSRYMHGGRRPLGGPHDPPGPPPTNPASLTPARPRKGSPMNNRLIVDVPRNLWMSSNRPITNHGQRTRTRDGLHALTALAARAQRLIAHDLPVRALWTVRYPKGTGWEHGDPTNAHPTTKAILDALVAGKWLTGDGPRHVVFEGFSRGPNLDRQSWHTIELTLEHVPTNHGAEPARMRALYLERWGL